MAHKIRKATSTPPVFLFIELLVPWLIMGAVAVLVSAAGASLGVIFAVCIACALAATFLMREFERYRRRRQARAR